MPASRTDALLGGDADRLAIDVGGHRLTYAEVAERIQVQPVGPGVVNASNVDPVEVLIQLYAGITAGRPVLVADPAQSLPPCGELPAGTEVLVTTSGSAGRPRVVARTLESWLASFEPLAQISGLTADDVVGLTGPLHASLHLFAAVHTLWLGGTLTDDIAGATAVHCVPAKLAELIASPRKLRTAVVAGAALNGSLAGAAGAAGIEVTQYYGAAELSFVAIGTQSLQAFPGVEIDVRGGVLWARSPYLALGYAGADAGALQVDADGFASVGDLAELQDGELIVRGRGDAAITTGGETVIAEDVEAVLAALPGVRGVAVVGLPHERFGEIVVAVLDLSPDADTAAIKAAARAQLKPHALPRRWLTAQLPRTPSDKVARAAVRAGLLDGSLDAHPLL